MEARPWLIFDLDGVRFGLDATKVRESVWLPELTPVEEAPPWVVGLFNLRGQMVPVVDLHLRFGHPARLYSPSDQVVVLEGEHQATGLIVSEIREVIELSSKLIQPPPQFEVAVPGPAHLVAGEASVGDDLVTLLDLFQLTHLPAETPPEEAAERSEPCPNFFPEATPEVRALFHQRAMTLRKAAVEEKGALLGLAVVELGGEFFGVELTAVQEFCDIVHLSPIPCCPPHILGAMDLRGDLLTLIDPRAALNLPPAASGGKAVIVRLGEQAAGIAVDAVHTVLYLRGEEVQPPPPALNDQGSAEITGTAPYGDKMMTVLDLQALLGRQEWIVNEEC
jgi:purine-binding chemotaxis protein CheW